MLIWGWKARQKVIGSGTFFSPALGADGPYELVEARRWFTLFFIPIIPLNVLGTFVRCTQSNASYDPKVLEGPTNAQFMDQLSAAVREIVVAVAKADDMVTDEERRLAVEIVRGYSDSYTAEMFETDLARSAAEILDDRLAFLSTSLNESGKERLLTAAATMMTADGSIDERDRAAVIDVGEKLTMTPAHVRGVLMTVEENIIRPG
ncbi:MAG: hypothetical protein AAGC53_10380 [Actinomycetota bacterium]